MVLVLAILDLDGTSKVGLLDVTTLGAVNDGSVLHEVLHGHGVHCGAEDGETHVLRSGADTCVTQGAGSFVAHTLALGVGGEELDGIGLLDGCGAIIVELGEQGESGALGDGTGDGVAHGVLLMDVVWMVCPPVTTYYTACENKGRRESRGFTKPP